MPIRLPDVDRCHFCDIIGEAGDRWNVIEQTAATLTILNGRQFEVGQCLVERRPAQFAYDVVTDAKRHTAEVIRRHFAAGV